VSVRGQKARKPESQTATRLFNLLSPALESTDAELEELERTPQPPVKRAPRPAKDGKPRDEQGRFTKLKPK
jgi:hypothetical protein